MPKYKPSKMEGNAWWMVGAIVAILVGVILYLNSSRTQEGVPEVEVTPTETVSPTATPSGTIKEIK